jgi:transcription elongation GreA/GreB family factor
MTSFAVVKHFRPAQGRRCGGFPYAYKFKDVDIAARQSYRWYNTHIMNRAFVKESDREDELPEIPISEHPNRITPDGLEELRARLDAVREERRILKENAEIDATAVRHVERLARWLDTRIATAVVIDPEQQPRDRVAFGAMVDVVDQDGHEMSYRIVGEDEADAEHGRVSWVSPIARALLGAQVGDEVVWKRPVGDLRIEVRTIGYGDRSGS